MNVIISNKQQALLSGLDIDIIKSVTGEFDADEIVEMFKNFFFGRMILDLTAIKEYNNIENLQKISMNLDVEKIILLLPPTGESVSSNFISKLVSMGIYNFTTDIDGVRYLLDHPNTYRDVAHVQQLTGANGITGDSVLGTTRIVGFKNVTEHAGSTTLIYMLKKALEKKYDRTVAAIEVGKRDFAYFNSKNMISTTKEQLASELLRQKDTSIVLIDMNDYVEDGTFHDVIYLIEPSTIKLNKLIRRNRHIFEKLKGKKVVLNKSLLTSTDVQDFEYEAKTKTFYQIPPLNDRTDQEEIETLLQKLGLVTETDDNQSEVSKIRDLFKF